MATNLKLDEELLTEALKLGGLQTKRETVNQALLEFVQRRRQLDILKYAGTVDFDPEYDYKAERWRR